MGDLIGYKGTPDERLSSWVTMVELRKSVRWMEERGERFKPSIDKERNWYKEEFQNYLAA